ncbi:hypothetical protein Tco_1136318 [Tanacetum coccineum]
MKGKSVEIRFEKSSVIRQPNAFKSQRQSILGKPAIFSDSLAKKDFSKSKTVTKQNVSNDFSKPVTAQILPQNVLPIVKNTNVIAPGIRPQLKSNQLEDRVMSNNSQGKKQEVEDHRNASRTANILEHKAPRCSTVSNTPSSSNYFAARRDSSIHRTVKFGNDQIAPILGIRMIWFKERLTTKATHLEGPILSIEVVSFSSSCGVSLCSSLCAMVSVLSRLPSISCSSSSTLLSRELLCCLGWIVMCSRYSISDGFQHCVDFVGHLALKSASNLDNLLRNGSGMNHWVGSGVTKIVLLRLNRSKMSFHQALDLILELDEVAVGCTHDILRERDCLDQLSEIPWVVPTFVVIEVNAAEKVNVADYKDNGNFQGNDLDQQCCSTQLMLLGLKYILNAASKTLMLSSIYLMLSRMVNAANVLCAA